MQRKKMDVVLGLSYGIGLLLIGGAATVYYGNGSNSVALWLLIGGLVWAVLTGGFQTQLIILESNKHDQRTGPPKPAGPSEGEINHQRAYVIVESSEIRHLATDSAVEGWISLKNNGLTPAFELQRWSTIFTTNTRIPNLNALNSAMPAPSLVRVGL